MVCVKMFPLKKRQEMNTLNDCRAVVQHEKPEMTIFDDLTESEKQDVFTVCDGEYKYFELSHIEKRFAGNPAVTAVAKAAFLDLVNNTSRHE